MKYSSEQSKNDYKKYIPQRKINLIRLREEYTHMNQAAFAKDIDITAKDISTIENGEKNLSLFHIQAYRKYFMENCNLDVSVDYLMGYTSVIENGGMNTSNELGLSGKSIEVLKSWNKLKKNPKEFAVSYGVTDINTLNLLLEDYYDLQHEANKKGHYAGFSIFHFIGNYIFSERFRKCPTNIIKYEHKSTNPEIGNPLSVLKIGDTVSVDEEEQTILNLYTYDERNHEANSDKMAYYNIENTEEVYNVSFQDMLKAYSKENISKIIKRIKKRIQGE